MRAMSTQSHALASLEPNGLTVRINDLSPTRENPSLSWLCSFGSCSKLRIYEGGRPDIAKHYGWCAVCQSLVVTDAKDQEGIVKLIDQHLM
jgi:hypothetical protein